MPAPANYDPARFEVMRRYVQRHGEGKVDFSYRRCRTTRSTATTAIGSAVFARSGGRGKDGPRPDPERPRGDLRGAQAIHPEVHPLHETDPVFSQGKRREDIASWGLCADEFTASGNFPPQLYVRESRRMQGMYVIIQGDILENPVKPDPIMVASFPIDSHDCRRVAINGGGVINEGTIFPVRQMPERIGYPYHVPYRAILPQPAECDNLLVPVALSCTHVAMSSLRIEATWMLSSARAPESRRRWRPIRTWRCRICPMPRLKPRLEAQGQVLTLPNGFKPAERPRTRQKRRGPNPAVPTGMPFKRD